MGLGLRFRARLALDLARARLLGVPLECRRAASADGLAGRPSPPGTFHFEVDGRPALLCYGRPSTLGREIFGGVVPYGELWRTGANEPTVIHLPFASEIAGLRAPRGSFSLYTVPDPARWLLVVNRSTRQWGLTRSERGPAGRWFHSAYHDLVRKAELGRAPVETRKIAHVEQLTARAEMRAGSTTLLLEWETTQIRIPIRARAGRSRA